MKRLPAKALATVPVLAFLSGAAVAETAPDDPEASAAVDGLHNVASESPSPTTIPFPTVYSLGLDADLVIEGNIFKEGHSLLHTDGGFARANTALGFDALTSVTLDMPNPGDGQGNSALGRSALRNTTSGIFNSAVGGTALYANTTGDYNTALGTQALFSTTTGNNNTAVGRAALGSNTIGSGNTATGDLSLFDNTGSFNAATGYAALRNLATGSNNTAMGTFSLFDLDSGSNNVALGLGAGSFLDDGSNNIYLGNAGESVESDTIRIGDSDTHTATFVAGVRGTNVANGLTVLVGSLGRLGTTTSSRRFKENIRSMGEASTAVLALRPVTFSYRDEGARDDTRPVDFGLIAEEVAEIYPELVAYDEEGEPYSVRYHVLPALLLNELQKQQQDIVALRRELRAVRARLGALETENGRAAADAPPTTTARRRP